MLNHFCAIWKRWLPLSIFFASSIAMANGPSNPFAGLFRLKNSSVGYQLVDGRLHVVGPSWSFGWLSTQTLQPTTGAAPGSMIDAPVEAFLLDDNQILVATEKGVSFLVPRSASVGTLELEVIFSRSRGETFVVAIDSETKSLSRLIGINAMGGLYELNLTPYRVADSRPSLRYIQDSLRSEGLDHLLTAYSNLFDVSEGKYQMRGPLAESPLRQRGSVKYTGAEAQVEPQNSWGPNEIRLGIAPSASHGSFQAVNLYTISLGTTPDGDERNYFVQARADGSVHILREDSNGLTVIKDLLPPYETEGGVPVSKTPPEAKIRMSGSVRQIVFQRGSLEVAVFPWKGKVGIERKGLSIIAAEPCRGVLQPPNNAGAAN